MTGNCYRILENPSIGLQRYRVTREAVTHLLAAALVHCDHMFSEFLLFCLLPEAIPSYFPWLLSSLSCVKGATLKITQMLQHFEHVAPVFAQAVSLWAKEYGLKSLVGELLRWEKYLEACPSISSNLRHPIPCFIFLCREIGQKCPQDLAREASGVKGYATFISELAEQIPALVLSNMSVLLPHLDGEVRFCEVTCPEKSNSRDAAIQFFCLKTEPLSQSSSNQNLLYGIGSALT